MTIVEVIIFILLLTYIFNLGMSVLNLGIYFWTQMLYYIIMSLCRCVALQCVESGMYYVHRWFSQQDEKHPVNNGGKREDRYCHLRRSAATVWELSAR